MLQPLRHYHWYQAANKSLSGVALGVTTLCPSSSRQTPHPSALEDRRYILVFDGELYNRDELRRSLGGEIKPANGQHNAGEAEDVTLVLQALRRWETRALDRFNGLFQFAWWDKQKHELILAGDHGGLRPLYFAHFNETFMFAPEVKALLALPSLSRAIDFQGIRSFLHFGFPLSDRTFFQNVEVLPPGAFARFHHGRLHIERYWRIQYQEKAALPMRAAQEQFLETFNEVIQRQATTASRLGSLLSGGLDTRLILATLVAQGRRVPTFTFGAPDSKDFRIAQRVAHTAKCTNLSSPILSTAIANGLEQAIYLTDGLYNCFHANIRYLLPSLAQTVDLVFDGISPLDSNYHRIQMPLIRWRSRHDHSRWLRQVYGNWMIGDLRALRLGARECLNLLDASLDLTGWTGDYLEEFVQTAAGNFQGPLSLSELFDFEEYTPRFAVFGPNLLRSVVNVRCPFYDKKILELAAQLPPSLRSKEKRLHKFAIQRLAPALAKIPTDRSPLLLNAGLWRTHLHLGARYISHQTQMLREFCFARAAADSNSPPMLDYNELLRTTPPFWQLVHKYLIDDWKNGSRFFDRHSVQTLLEHHKQGQGNHADLIGRLLTLEIWHRLFVSDTSMPQMSHSDVHEFMAAEAA